MSKAQELAAKAARMKERHAARPEPANEGSAAHGIEKSQAVQQESPAAVTAEREQGSAAAARPVEQDQGSAATTARLEGSPAVRVKPVRLTVDVSPGDHKALAHWSLEAAAQLGLARVAGQDLVRALLSRALADPTLKAEIVRDVARARANR